MMTCLGCTLHMGIVAVNMVSGKMCTYIFFCLKPWFTLIALSTDAFQSSSVVVRSFLFASFFTHSYYH